MDIRKQMRKWQQDLAISSGEAEGLANVREISQDIVREPASDNSSAKKAIAMTSYHWSAIVFVGTAVLLLAFQPFFVHAPSKERPYEAPTISYLTVFILSALAALGHQLSLGGE
jgi:hypothetical protein